MESDLFQLAVLLLVAWLVLRFVARLLPDRPARPSDPFNFAGHPAKLRPRPGRGSAAVALAEPDEDDEDAQP